jgi:hypothetical protein
VITTQGERNETQQATTQGDGPQQVASKAMNHNK